MTDSADSTKEDTLNRYQQALASVQNAVEKFRNCTPEEKDQLRADLTQLQDMDRFSFVVLVTKKCFKIGFVNLMRI